MSKLVFAAAMLALLDGCASKVFDNIIAGSDKWYFLDKFVFDTSGQGVLRYYVQVQIDQVGTQSLSCDGGGMFFNFSNAEGNIVGLYQCQNGTINPASLLFYNDVEGSGTDWNSIYYDDSLTCEERTSRAQLIVPLDLGIINANEQLGVKPSAIPHYWYVAISSCAYPNLAASVKIEFQNAGWEKNAITSQFSYDDQGLYEMSIFFFVAYLFCSAFVIYFVRTFMINNIMHEIHWMLVASFGAYWTSHMMNMIHFKKYSEDGVGIEWLSIFSNCWQVVGYVIFVNVLLLIGRGWMITTNKLSRKMENAIISGFIVLIYTALFFSNTLRDPGDSSYLYDSWPGYLFIGMNMFLLVLFDYLLHRTFVFEKRIVKRNFYKRFGFIFSLWFIQLPIFVLMARGISPYYRQKILFGIQWCVQFIAFSIIPFLSRPKNAFEIYNAENNFDSRIPSLARQQRVQPSAIELPASQGGRQTLPPVNRNMTSSLAEADATARAGAGAGRAKAELDHTLHGFHKGNGEGIVEP